MTTTQRTFVQPRTATPDDAGWRFDARSAIADERVPARPVRSLSWRLRH
jgi:hypothetical protein